MSKRGFGSDNFSGVFPEVMEALNLANVGHQQAYGYDDYTDKADRAFKAIFGDDTTVIYTFNGTGANCLALGTMVRSFNSIIAVDTAHINVDECGAPENLLRCKIETLSSDDGKLTVDMVKPLLHSQGVEHHSQPKVISITQSSEMGTVYSVKEVRELADFAHAHGMYLHMDGARIANAAVSLGGDVREFTSDAGVDVLSFGGGKNGMMYGEAVLFFNKELAKDAKFYRKNYTQLASKMRYISAQFDAILKNDLWLERAANSNAMALKLAKELETVNGIELTQQVQANEVFATVPKEYVEQMQKICFFYVWDDVTGEVRFVCSWDTTEEDIDNFCNEVKKILVWE